MADKGHFAKDADILLRVGDNASAAVKTAGWFDSIIIDAEAIINCITRFDWAAADNTVSLVASVRGMLVDSGASLSAINGINFDMSSFTSRIEAEDMVNILRDRVLFNLAILRDKKVQKFIQEA